MSGEATLTPVPGVAGGATADQPISAQTQRPKANVTLLAGVLVSLAFTSAIWAAGGLLEAVPHAPDQGASWYYWKLTEPTFWTRATAWGFYLLHQVAFWWVIWYAQRSRPRYSDRLHRFNWWAIGVNALFISAHFAQTHLWYDGLAQDVSIWSSQASVVVMLVWVLILENRRRGVFFGKSMPFSQRVTDVARRYHGYYFAWATVYTFWYHPMEATSGHLIGFLYMFLLLVQGSLFFTRAHRNRWWTLTLELSVVAHGTLVAVMQGNGIWPMFAFGFGGIFIITQMHGLGWSRLVRGLLLGAYMAGAIAVYATRDIGQLYQIVNIPVIDYVLLFVLALLLGGIGRLIGTRRPAPREAAPAAATADSVTRSVADAVGATGNVSAD